MIQFQRVSKIYSGGKPALQNISFTLSSGEMAFLTGHSGAGKSTLMRLTCGLEKANDGKVLLNGIDVSNLKKHDIPFLRRTIGMVFQDHQLLMDHTVYDNVAIPLIILGKPAEEIRSRVSASLDKVGLIDKMKFYPIQLSGGEQQRVGIARAIVNHPSVLLADEPTGNLDDKLSKDILKLFEEFNQAGVTVLMATHNIGLIRRKHHRILHLTEGRLEVKN
ncbi:MULTISPECIES: cell division ATP-binding protein FtsE [unclassified Gilliamella]|jgi:cell division transport system ATP-binding protein|uniref:cell division ATP-binding protein FtsE n=1 Tax=unclassified Gilliamella TaxID=2685620 RepID=UPI00080DCFD7|nr:cell division ATP-binding protein FtsE [Gilliamella apicola]OCG17530.1 cell division ATP-binding protein FtsE [Gilliamella apicola]OCG31296.1 cell division ATP-binding protein FtsE [Gilliamella apicola]OCG32205.1 cell division ATP-binding protein FtsE [Gilliamella apicola]OCG66260.1 cell division ATP-binding protein FtsE [Gilliamella apicola]OCG76769.1 cell division ATP-binding protein FtsE [Gilliamella apicola]